MRKITMLLVFILSIFLVNIQAGERKEIKKTFEGKKMIRIQTISGDCIIKKSKGSEIEVLLMYNKNYDIFEPIMEEDGDTLILREEFHGSGDCDSLWKITAPVNTSIKSSSISGNFSVEGLSSKINTKTVSGDISAKDCKGDIQFKSASGDFEIENLRGDITLKGASSEMEIEEVSGRLEVRTASGDVEAVELEGDITIKVASGDIKIKKSKGEFEITTASGDIDASNILIQEASVFKVASGDIEVILTESASHDLTLKSASGNAVLNYNGNPIKGWFEFTALADDGQIISPYRFDKEEKEEKWGKVYDIKSFEKSGKTPKIYIKTASGKAVLKKK